MTDRARALRYLANGPATPEQAADPRLVLLRGEGRAPLAIRRDALKALLAERLLRRDGDCVAAAEKATLSAIATGRERRKTPGGFEEVEIDSAESPLALLKRLKSRDGGLFLADGEWRAGERLRRDYTRGAIMPRLSANWEASVSSGRRAGGVAELTEAALAARLRVDRALGAVGPELSGMLVDVCCFLKGLEQVELERQLPARSAKVLLKAGLAMLARHYEPAAATASRARFHWGAADFRPSINPGA